MIVLRPEDKKESSINHVPMSYEQIQQPWDGQNRPWGHYKQASSTVTVSGCGDRANQKFLRAEGCKSLIFPSRPANPKFLTSSSYGVFSTSANRLLRDPSSKSPPRIDINAMAVNLRQTSKP
eukprot:scaffold249353_cov82-Cyclotella_meneghiniana.AAC.8